MTAGGQEIRAVLKGAQADAADAVEQAGAKLASFTAGTAQRVQDSVSTVLNADGASADLVNGVQVRLDDGDAAPGAVSAGRTARMPAGGLPPAGRVLFSGSPAAVTNREILESGAGLPRTAATVQDVARRAGIDLQGTTVHIVGDADGDYIRYLDCNGACACAPVDRPGQIDIGPASFLDEETLAATLAHEQTHVLQYKAGYNPNSGESAEMERLAYAAEHPALARLRGEKP